MDDYNGFIGEIMFVFNLKKEWFDKIKSGEKTHEYRKYNDYWKKRFDKYVWVERTECEFRLGYPKNTEKDKILKGLIKMIYVVNGEDTDLKCKGKVFDVEFKLLEE